MATLRISYFGGCDKHCAVDPIATEAITTSGTSAVSGAIPAGAGIAKITAVDSSHIFTIGTGTPVAADGAGGSHILIGEVMWLRIESSTRAAKKIAAITV